VLQRTEPSKYVTVTNVLSLAPPLKPFTFQVAGMPHKKRKISDLTTADANSLLQSLNQFQDSLDDGDEDLPSGLLVALAELRMKLEAIKVSYLGCQ